MYYAFMIHGQRFIIDDIVPADVTSRSLQALQASVFPPAFCWTDEAWVGVLRREGHFLALRKINATGSSAELVGALICVINADVYEYSLQFVRADCHRQGHTIRMALVLAKFLDPEKYPRILVASTPDHFLTPIMNENLTCTPIPKPSSDFMFRAVFPTAEFLEVLIGHAETERKRMADNLGIKPREKLKARM